MDNQKVKSLLERYLQGTASQSEVELLETWYLNFRGKPDEKIDPVMIEESTDSVWQRLQQPLQKTVRLWPRIAVAASLFIAVTTAGYFYFRTNKPSISIAQQNDLPPGKDGATLTLDDGKKIQINEALVGNIAKQSGVMISKSADGQLIYEQVPGADNVTAFNTLATSAGQQIQVRLPDGSTVFLNAESSLRYPTRFDGQGNRVVMLTGEGYFQVAKDARHPFIVNSGEQQVEVLGTQFNIQSYDRQKIRTTLLEGSIAVTAGERKKIVLRPGQQAVVDAGGISVREVEAEYEIAWTQGFFLFNDESLLEIMNRIANWYNVQIVFADPSLKRERFTGTVSRFEQLSKVLDVLEKIKVATFKLEGRTIIISRST